jgi:hypothetical protein
LKRYFGRAQIHLYGGHRLKRHHDAHREVGIDMHWKAVHESLRTAIA